MQHEQSLADAFNVFMRGQALERGYRFHSFSLDGQDRDTGADYVLTDADRFSIVEFKYTERDLVSEGHKPRRLQLCTALLDREDMRKLHDRCHYISWADGPSAIVMVNIYRHEVCTQSVFGPTSGLPALVATPKTRVATLDFAQEFFRLRGGKSLSLAQFESYISWLLTETSGSTRATLELLAYNPFSKDLALVRLNSISEAQSWVREHLPLPPLIKPNTKGRRV